MVKKLIVFLFASLLFHFFPGNVHAKVLFSDNFDTPNPSKWSYYLRNCPDNSWNFLNGKFGGSITKAGGCYTMAVPSDDYWNNNNNDYTVEFDMQIVRGYDKNIAWRINSDLSWIGLHIFGSNYELQRAVITRTVNRQPFINGNTYHIKVVAEGHNHLLEYFNINDPINLTQIYAKSDYEGFLYGKPGLQASVGAGGPDTTEVWFDNFIVYSNLLDVSFFSQRDSLWAENEYDSASKYYPDNVDNIENLGCALTSSSMVMKYFGFDALPGGQELNPGSVNSWFLGDLPKEHEWRNAANPWMTYSYLARLVKDNDPSLPHLEHRRRDYDYELFKQVLDADKPSPVILRIWEPGSPSGVHFVVARGYDQKGNIYVMDPYFHDRNIIASDSAILTRMDWFEPKESDLSYLVIHADQEVEILLENENGAQTGGEDGLTEMENSWYGLELPILPTDGTEPSVEPFNELAVPKPESGEYKLILYASIPGTYEFEIHGYGIDGTPVTIRETVVFDQPGTKAYILDFSKTESGEMTLTQEVGFDDLRKLILKLVEEKEIKNKGIGQAMIAFVDSAERFYSSNLEKSVKFLEQVESFVTKHTPKLVSINAETQILNLLKDLINYLY